MCLPTAGYYGNSLEKGSQGRRVNFRGGRSSPPTDKPLATLSCCVWPLIWASKYGCGQIVLIRSGTFIGTSSQRGYSTARPDISQVMPWLDSDLDTSKSPRQMERYLASQGISCFCFSNVLLGVEK